MAHILDLTGGPTRPDPIKVPIADGLQVSAYSVGGGELGVGAAFALRGVAPHDVIYRFLQLAVRSLPALDDLETIEVPADRVYIRPLERLPLCGIGQHRAADFVLPAASVAHDTNPPNIGRFLTTEKTT